MEQDTVATTPVMDSGKQKDGKGWKIATVIASCVTICGIGFGVYGIVQSLQKDNQILDLEEQIKNKDEKIAQIEASEEIIDSSVTDAVASTINKRFYSVNSDLNQQKYYLLLDDATYGADQNFLDRKTYILDMDMSNNKQIVKEVDLASVFKPIADNYINDNRGNAVGDCSVEYFSATRDLTPPNIDYDKEVAFKGYYKCVNNGTETSLGSVVYAYDVEANTIRILGKA